MKNFDSVNNENRPARPPMITSSDRPMVQPSKVSLLAGKQKSRGSRLLKFILLAIVAVILVLGASVALRAANLSGKIFVGQKTSFFHKLKEIVGKGGETKLVGEDLGQINVLLLGIGGEGHDGPYLTDTIILAQIRPDLGKVSLTSVPRDYLVSLPDNLGQRKLNAAFTEGYIKHRDWNEGGKYAIKAVEGISGLEIPYFAVVDFAGFEKAIDQIGGLDITIERTFTDYKFPDDRLVGYLPPVTFEEGTERMNGKRALQFARSRHAAGPEGSDFARSQRQQKIIQAFKDKVTGLNLFSDAGKLNGLMSIFADHFHTNISPAEILRVYNLVKSQGEAELLSLSLDTETRLICPKTLPENGAYVLVPCENKSAQDVQRFFKNSFALGKLYQEKSVIWLSDSTPQKSSYRAADRLLKDAGLTVWEVSYTKQVFPQTIFYQVNPKPATAEFLKSVLGATEATLPPPGYKIDSSKVDLIVILGESQ